MFKDDHLFFKHKPEHEKESILHQYRMKALSKLPPDVRESVLRADKTSKVLKEHISGKHRAFYDTGGSIGSTDNQQTGQEVQSDMNNNDAQSSKDAQVQTTADNSNKMVPQNQPPQTPVNPFGPPSSSNSGGSNY